MVTTDLAQPASTATPEYVTANGRVPQYTEPAEIPKVSVKEARLPRLPPQSEPSVVLDHD